MPTEEILGADAIARHVARLGAEIERDHPDGVVLVGVLKGALLFLADLARAVTRVAVEVDFISISRFAPDSGRVKILHDLQVDLTGRDVVVVEDIVDTGLTLAYLTGQLESRGARSVAACALLDRRARRIVPQVVRYRGIELADEYVLGYGLHHRDLYRNLPFVVRADRSALDATPDVYVARLYGAGRGGIGPPEAGGRVPEAERRLP